MKKLASVLVSLFFLGGLFLSSLFFSVDNTLLQADFHVKNFKKINFYQRVGGVIPVLMMGEGPQSGQKMLLLGEEDLGEIMEKSLPAGWLQEEMEESLEEIFAYLKNERESLSVRVELGLVKESLQRNFIRAFRARLEQLPDCSWEEAKRMRTGKVEGLDCLPPQVEAGRLAEEFGGQIAGEIQKLPDTIELGEQLSVQAEEQLQQIRRGYRVFGYIKWATVGVTVAFLLILWLLQRRGILGYLKGMGWVVFGCSLLGLVGQRWLVGRLSSEGIGVLPAMPGMGSVVLEGVREDLIVVTLSSYLDYLSKINVVLLVAAGGFLVFLIIRRLLKKERAGAEG